MSEPKQFKLPEPGFPLVNRVQADPPFPTDGDTRALRDQEPDTWENGKPHPIDGESSTVVRMFTMPGQGVEVYCLAEGKNAAGQPVHTPSRHTIPWNRIRDIEELMDPETFVGEIQDAEDEDGAPRPHTNGAAAS